MNIKIPAYVNDLIAKLEAAGHEAFVVGGCVRDSLLGKLPQDWDVCTSAKPEETKACFENYKTIDTGIKHGTVAVVVPPNKVVEITTYRVDGDYTDSRHPDKVTFSRNLSEDLARRDFSINAMAYSDAKGLIDPYNGSRDLAVGTIRCVGDPRERFSEDALRIVRALRFASVLGFQINRNTDLALKELAPTAEKVARERVAAEFLRLIAGEAASEILIGYRTELETILGTKMEPDDKLGAVSNIRADGYLKEGVSAARLALVFGERTGEALSSLKFDNKTIRLASSIAKLLDGKIPKDRIDVKLMMRDYGLEATAGLLEALKAISGTQQVGSATDLYRDNDIFDFDISLGAVIKENECCSLAQLAVNGKDLIEAGGMSGPKLGGTLDRLLEEVIRGRVPNNREELLAYAQTLDKD